MYIRSIELGRQANAAIHLSKKTLNIPRKHFRATIFHLIAKHCLIET